jgi:hypothetical protein
MATDSSNIRLRLQSFIKSLLDHGEIAVNTAKIGAPSTPAEIEEARALANGHLPAGVEEFYSAVGYFTLEWEYVGKKFTPWIDPSKLPPDADISRRPESTPRGVVKILPITEIFQAWEGSTWFPLQEGEMPSDDDEWRYTYKHVKPFDCFEPEACVAFLLDANGRPRDQVAYFYYGQELRETKFSFLEYIDLMMVSRGYSYWSKAITSIPEHNDFLLFGPKIFEDIGLELFLGTDHW